MCTLWLAKAPIEDPDPVRSIEEIIRVTECSLDCAVTIERDWEKYSMLQSPEVKEVRKELKCYTNV